MTSTNTTTTDRRQQRRVAVLGGTGFVGEPVCRTLADRGHRVVAIARRRPATESDIPVRTLDLAAADSDELAAILVDERVDTVINAAGGMWGLNEAEMVAANVTLTERAIAATAALPARRRFVQIGSVHEYGLTPIGTSMREDTPAEPVTAYGRLKLECTQKVAEATQRGEIDGVTLRIGNVVGARQPAVSLLGVVAATLWEACAAGQRAEVRCAPLGALRDFLNLSDAVEAIVAAVTVATLPDRVLNVGSGRARTARDLVQLLMSVSGVPADLIERDSDGPGESMWQQLCVDQAQRFLGWSPRGDLVDGMKELWEYQTDSADR